MKARILIVDDEEFIRGELSEALDEAGFETQSAGDGEEVMVDPLEMLADDVKP